MCGSFITDRLPTDMKSVLVGPGSSPDVRATKRGLEEVGLKKKKMSVDPTAERAAAEADAATKANTRIAFQRKAMRENSLLTGGGQAAAGTGRSTLGV